MSGGCGGRIYRLHLGLNFNFFQNLERHQLGGHPRGFGYAYRDVCELAFAKARAADGDGVISHRQQRCRKGTVAISPGGAGEGARVLIHDADLGIGYYRTA